MLAADTDLWTDAIWVIDSTPVECGRSRPTVKRSELAGWAGYGYCCQPLPVLLGTAPAPGLHPGRTADHLGPGHPKIDERQVLMAILDHDPTLTTDRPGLLIIADKGYVSRELDGSWPTAA